MEAYVNVLRILIFGTCLPLLTRMIVSGIFRIYPWFCSYILAETLRILVSYQISIYSDAYTTQWKIASIVKAVLLVFVVLEMYRVAMAGKPALARYGQRVAKYVILAGALLSGLMLWLFGTGGSVQKSTVHNYFAFLQTMDCWMLVMVAAILWYVLWFPVRLSRNALLYIIGFGVFFFSETVSFLVAGQLTLYQGRGIRDAALAVYWLCLVCWTVALGGRGGHKTTVIGHFWNREKAERLNAQLDSINERLERVKPKGDQDP